MPPAISRRRHVFAVRRYILPGALSAEHDGPHVLVLHCIVAFRLADSPVVRIVRYAGKLLILDAVSRFRRERQIFDRRPANVRTDLRDVVIRIAGGEPPKKGKGN